MTDGEKFKEFLKSKGIKPTEAAQKLNKPHRNYIYNYFKTESFSSKIKDELDETFGFKAHAIEKPLRKEKARAGDFKENIIKVKSAKGNAIDYSMEKAIASVYKHQKEVRDFQVTGESMIPNLKDGDILRTYRIEPEEVRDNYVYVIIYNDYNSILVKRVKNRIETRNELILRSDNEEYDQPIYLALQDVNEIYHVHQALTFNLGQKSNIESRLTDLEIDVEQIKDFINYQ